MKIYKVKVETRDCDTGRPNGYELIGYYTNKEKAQKIALELDNKPYCEWGITHGKCTIDEIETID